jgi:hypothetical protein
MLQCTVRLLQPIEFASISTPVSIVHSPTRSLVSQPPILKFVSCLPPDILIVLLHRPGRERGDPPHSSYGTIGTGRFERVTATGSPSALCTGKNGEILLIAAIGAGLSKPVESKRVFAVGTEMMQLGKPLLGLEDAQSRHADWSMIPKSGNRFS